jgi:alpha-D-xyloside xylohydrolase
VQNVWLPAGETWYNFWSDAKSAGSDTADKAYVTSTGEIIMYVKAGSLLPRYRYAQSTAFIDKTHLEVDVYSGKDGSFTVYEDDGVTEEFRVDSAASTTELTYTDSTGRVVVDHPVGTYRGAPTERRYVVRVHGLAAPVGMRVGGGAPLPAFTSESAAVLNGGGVVWNSTRKILSVVTPTIAVVTGGGVATTVEPSGTAFPTPSDRTVHDAVDATLGGVVIGSAHRGYTGNGYVDYTNATADFVEWTVPVPAAGPRALGFRHANGGTTDRPLAISVNGVAVGTLPFSPTGSWTTWGIARLTAALPAGTSVKIRATATGSSGGNLDSLIIG